MPNDTQENIEILQNKEEENTSDYAFLHEDQQNNSEENFSDKFDLAFNQSSPAIQNYILSDKFEENIKLICKIQKLDDDKSNTIIENIAVSILVGILPITEAKNTLIESFKSSGILLEDSAAALVLKNIDSYILSDIRKHILQSKVENNKEIRHLTLRQNTEEKEKEELRKILLEKTGNLNGKGEILVQYQTRDNNLNKENGVEKEIKKEELNRDSLLAKINLKNVSDTDKIKERMTQIRKEEEERVAKLAEEEKEKEEIRNKREEEQKKQENESVKNNNDEVVIDKEEEEGVVSNIFAETLKEDLNKQNRDGVYYSKEMGAGESATTKTTNATNPESFDPYRETF